MPVQAIPVGGLPNRGLIPRGLRAAAVVLSLTLPLSTGAVAQAVSPATGTDRAWVDPPARSPAPAPTVKTQDVPVQVRIKSPPSPAARREAFTSRPAPTIAKRQADKVQRPQRLAERPAFRVAEGVVHRRMARPAYRSPVVGRYDNVQFFSPSRVNGFEADRARRIRQAEEAGYLVVRSQTLVFPDGRHVRTYRPYDDDDSDD